MGEHGLARVREKFSCEAQLSQIEKLYERLLSRERGQKLARAGEGVRREVEVDVKP
jgi:hypothetical protein